MPDDASAPLDAEAVTDDSWRHFGPTGDIHEEGDAEVSDEIGPPGWARTSDFLINSEPQDPRTDIHRGASARDSEGW